MSVKLTFRIDLSADYHVGTGHGLGTEVDSALMRDSDNVPVLRGSTVSGLLRDGLWQLLQLDSLSARYRACQASGLTKDQTSDRYCGQHAGAGSTLAACPICRLFGTPGMQKHWRFGSARPLGHAQVAGDPYTSEILPAQKVTRVRVHPRTRRAAPNQLFSEEQGAPLTFEFSVTTGASGDGVLDEAALLVAAARMVRELGASRRRGQGECRFTLTAVEGLELEDDPQAALLQRFAERWITGEVPLVGQVAVSAPPELPALASDDSHTRRIRILARIDEPVIVAQRAMAGNRFETRPYVPGSVLRGALANQAARRFDVTADDVYDVFLRLFVRGAIHFSALYPTRRVSTGIYASVPVPHDAYRCKVYEDHPVIWGTQHATLPEQCLGQNCEQGLKRTRGGFYSIERAKAESFSPSECVEMHLAVDPETGRAAESQLYEYTALAAGQYLEGEMQLAGDEAWDALQRLTGLALKAPVPLHLGKATQRGYGKVTLWLEEVGPQPNRWVGQDLTSRVALGATDVTLFLLSDAMIVDPWGRYVTAFEADWLTPELQLPVACVESTYVDHHLVDGFNTTWHLPRWRAVALAAGAVVRLRLSRPVDQAMLDRLAMVEREGIGARRCEGYGQVAFNHPFYQGLTGVQGALRTIPDELALAIVPELQAGGDPAERWDEVLAQSQTQEQKTWAKLKGEPTTAVARWLHSHRNDSIESILAELDSLGMADSRLVAHIRAQRPDVEHEYGARDKKSRLTEAQALARDLLDRLREFDARYWPEGIGVLADCLAAAAGTEEE